MTDKERCTECAAAPDGLCGSCADAMKDEMRVAFAPDPESVEVVIMRRQRAIWSEMEALANSLYWEAGSGCAARRPGAEWMEDYCVMDEGCPYYQEGCLDIWLQIHGGNL